MKRLRRPGAYLLPLVSALAVSGLAMAGQSRAVTGKFEPPPGKMMVLIGCEWNDTYQQYKRLTGDTPAGGTFYYEFNSDTNFFWHNARENVGENGVLYIKFGLDVAGPDLNATLTPFLKGQKDDNIRKIGEAIKTWGRPVYVTLGSECDHWARRGYTPAQFVQVYRRIRSIWERMGVANVAYVWWVCGDGLNPRWAEFYPGDQYVDWVGISFYYGTKYARSLEPLGMMTAFTSRHRKPLMISESSPINGQVRTFEEWHGPALNIAHRMGARIICYNNWRELPTPDLKDFENSSFDRLPPSIAKAWGQAMKNPIFLHASPTLATTLGWKPGGQIATNDEIDKILQDYLRKQEAAGEKGAR